MREKKGEKKRRVFSRMRCGEGKIMRRRWLSGAWQKTNYRLNLMRGAWVEKGEY